MRTLVLVPLSLALTLGACKDAPVTGSYIAPSTTADADPNDSSSKETETMTEPAAAQSAPVLNGITMNRLDGTPETLADAYAGKTVLIVNTASACGLTPQYKGLETLYQSKKGSGLVVLGFPANDFMGQEPLSNDEIVTFCQQNYGVTFPMFEKTTVKGAGANELFARLNEATSEPSWNFTKYLVTPDGSITRFDPRTAPDDAELTAAIDAALGAG
ncbi:MAG: glutathione peroxidase [Planctomycetota bacterium]